MEYILIVFLLLGSAFFSGTEIAYTSLSKLKVKKEGEKQTPTEKLVGFIYNHYDFALSTVLVGNNLVNIAMSSIGSVMAILIAGDLFDGARVTKSTENYVLDLIASHPMIDFYYLSGNHDKGSALANAAQLPANLYTFGKVWSVASFDSTFHDYIILKNNKVSRRMNG